MSVNRKASWGGGTVVAFCDSEPPDTIEWKGRTLYRVATMTNKVWDGIYKGIYR